MEPRNPKYSQKDWDQVRLAFGNSLMVETRLTSLAQNVELPDWPIKGEAETPSKYVDFTWEELQELPGLADQPQRIDLLIGILQETLAFDDPFGEMVATVDEVTEKDDSMTRTLDRLEIPQDFPLTISGLAGDTLAFCKAESIETIGAFADFAQNMAQNVVVGGDFRALLNALAHLDEEGIARFLPFRPHSKGLHFPEAVGLQVRRLSRDEKYSLLKLFGKKLSSDQASAARLKREALSRLESNLKQKVSEIAEYFADEMKELRTKVRSGTTPERIFVVLNDEDVEYLCAHLSGPLLRQKVDSDSEDQPSRGFFARLFRRG